MPDVIGADVVEAVLCRRFATGVGDGGFGRQGRRQGHRNIDVLEDASWGDAKDAVGRFDEVVAFASGVLAAEVVDEAEAGTELFGFDEEAGAVCGPLL